MPRDTLSSLGLDIYASPDTTKYHLGQTRYYVEFKNELDYGERKLLDGAAIRGYERKMAEQGRDLDTSGNTLMFVTQLDRVAPLRLAVWLADWYIVARRPDGSVADEPLPDKLEDRVALFRRMRETFAQQLADLLDKHEEQMREERLTADVAAGILEKRDERAEDADPNPSPSATPSGEPDSAPQMLTSATAPAGPSSSSTLSQNPSWQG